jgi:DNA-binding transcriptional MocR family regulator
MMLPEQEPAVHSQAAPPRESKRTARRDRFAQIPYTVLFDQRISRDARLLYAVLQSHWWKHGECLASHATLAAEIGVKERMVRSYLSELVRAGHVVKRRRGRGRSVAYSSAVDRSDDSPELDRGREQDDDGDGANRQSGADEPAPDCRAERQESTAISNSSFR